MNITRRIDPMTLDRYIYGRDNPERYTDPNGHMNPLLHKSEPKTGLGIPRRWVLISCPHLLVRWPRCRAWTSR